MSGTLEVNVKGVAADVEVTVTARFVSPPPELLTPRWLVASPRASGEIGLSWRYDEDPFRVGYNLYRNGVKINTETILGNSYIDTGLTNGQTYGYVVKAFDSGGNESLPSNEAEATATSDPEEFGSTLAIYVGEELDVRIGDLTGDGYIDFLFSKWDDYKKAFNYKGELLWEIYTGSHGYIHYDWSADFTPTAIWDIDGDGKNEVVCQYVEGPSGSETWYLAILDGATGTIKRRVQIAGRMHHLSIANFRGLPQPQDIVICFKRDSESKNPTAFRGEDLTQLWTYTVSSVRAAYPKPADIDGDGKDEYIMGHGVLDHDGTWLMDLPISNGHTDSIMVSDFGLGGAKLILMSDESDGYLYMFNPLTRQIMWRIREYPGGSNYHEIDIANVRDDYPGLEIEVTIDDGPYTYLISNDGQIIWKRTGIINTEEAKLIQWTGDDLFEVGGENGIFDGYGNKVSEGYVSLWLGDVIGDYREEHFGFWEGWFYIVTNPELNPRSKPSIWESNPERVKEEYVNFAFY